MASLAECRAHIRLLHRMDEAECLEYLRRPCQWPRKMRQAMHGKALALIAAARAHGPSEIEAFLLEYSLSSADGQALMGLAEALLRIPDAATKDAMIADTLERGQWDGHRGHSDSAVVNLSSIALTLARRGVGLDLAQWPIRQALEFGMGRLGGIFVMGETIAAALRRAAAADQAGFRHSFDMLGEEARTAGQAESYRASYHAAIAAIGAASPGQGPLSGPGVSVKLSALHPRYHPLQKQRVMAELVPVVVDLCRAAQAVDIGLTIDAEEADRLDLSLDVVEAVLAAPGLAGWNGLGVAVQAYQKRAIGVIDWAAAAARHFHCRLSVRLVKGAYWDSEIKRAQERGLPHYPVFTTKAATDLSYLACAQAMLAAPNLIQSAFASHNAATIAAIDVLAGERQDWEFQRLHGMGEAVYRPMLDRRSCRVYAPVGRHCHLLPYLVRRLLENGANSSFVHLAADPRVAPEDVVNAPVDESRLAPPVMIFSPQRRLSLGRDLCDGETISHMQQRLAGLSCGDVEIPAGDPQDIVNQAIDAFAGWDGLGGARRADMLECAADLLEAEPEPFLHLAIVEAGKIWVDAIAEIREAVDFLRYYAAEARRLCVHALVLPAVTGEANQLEIRGRGVFVCISPWNFPLAIFIGQVAAALAAGNTVVAKPAPQTPRMAIAATALLHRAGVPPAVLAVVLGGADLGADLVGQPGIAGIAFTGSHATARRIAAILAQGQGPLVPLIAETGGVNAMIVDSSALPEQAAADIVASAFGAAGQRCSALRLLFVQEEIADSVLDLVAGMAGQMRLGDPLDPATDMGPLIDAAALARLQADQRALASHGRMLFTGAVPETGVFMAPTAYEVGWDHLPTHESFGPLLQVRRWRRDQLPLVLTWLRQNGHGLTLGIHSRIDTLCQQIGKEARIGNIYVNRGMTGAMVGCQPFGGMGLSGTGPKSGGPFTLLRYATEIVTSINVTARGGNVDLLCRRK
ncbi:proline dehydrogenase family protein [Magnetospirillum sulfuroxidans]|uniref:L-glutamate gamma-semialdehyde dehydrogenase n=1 Tax=Magnetospirillum sulfuroxidans TaxID=611300 RepID=A0ABS5I881_9PROT|nr:proline dehydrogenase family protein [Magnetospirillum sulfuroxidans]MBR9970649.1 proline dehydrogenase family protein [Magnetospirillum sulfuroxidans]